MSKLITTYWRDIPAQVIAKQGRKTAKVMLSQRFQEAIDRAAMRAGKGSSDAYMEDWRRVYENCGDDLSQAAKNAADALERAFSDEALETIVQAKGLAG
tara:strand:+ start:668 stop:964 length:297 start_codon:yes stop_codon:yes gene_type:complete